MHLFDQHTYLIRILKSLKSVQVHGAGLEALRKRLNERETPRVPTEELIKIADIRIIYLRIIF